MLCKISTQRHHGMKPGMGLKASKLSFKIPVAMIFIMSIFCATSQAFNNKCWTVNFYVREGDSFDLKCCEPWFEQKATKRMYVLKSPNGTAYIVDEGSAYEKEKIRIGGILNYKFYILDEGSEHGKEKIETFPDINKCGLRIKNFGIADEGKWECRSYVRKDGNLDALIQPFLTHLNMSMPNKQARLSDGDFCSNLHNAQFIDFVIAIITFYVVTFYVAIFRFAIDNIHDWPQNAIIGQHIFYSALVALSSFVACLLWYVFVNATMQRGFYWLGALTNALFK